MSAFRPKPGLYAQWWLVVCRKGKISRLIDSMNDVPVTRQYYFFVIRWNVTRESNKRDLPKCERVALNMKVKGKLILSSLLCLYLKDGIIEFNKRLKIFLCIRWVFQNNSSSRIISIFDHWKVSLTTVQQSQENAFDEDKKQNKSKQCKTYCLKKIGCKIGIPSVLMLFCVTHSRAFFCCIN